MPNVVQIEDRAIIERALRRDPSLHVYALGDLDDFFFPRTRWYGLVDQGSILDVALAYESPDGLVLHVLGREPARLRLLLSALAPTLPKRFYAHLSPGLSAAMDDTFVAVPHGTHLKMVLEDRRAIHNDPAQVAADALRATDLAELEAFYVEAYPGNWFDPRMLDTERYFGVGQDGQLVAVAGVHVYSPRYRVAALGNIATHPRHRRRGFAERAMRALLAQLLPEADDIGLNVDADNGGAIELYRRLGFRECATYEEMAFTARQ